MTIRQIHYMNIITTACSIFCRIISSVNSKMISSSYCYLCDIWHQVVRNTLWIFTHSSGLMCSDWVKVTKQNNCQIPAQANACRTMRPWPLTICATNVSITSLLGSTHSTSSVSSCGLQSPAIGTT